MTQEHMFDHITDDGPRDPDDIPCTDIEDEDLAYELQRQQEHDAFTALTDELVDELKYITLMQSPQNWWD